jgi:MacB-like periplasmic core domain
MRTFATLRSIISELFHRSLVENEIEEELRAHIQDRANDLERSGVPRAEAERRARIEFGGYQKYKEEIREAQGTHFLETLIQDLRFGLRMLLKSPGFTAVAILTLALGIGANTAIFTMTNGLMLHTLPVRDPGQLVELLHYYPGDPEPGFNGFSWDAYQTIRDGNHVFSDLLVGSMNFFSVRGDKLQLQTVFGAGVGGTFFQALGVRAAAGRLIGPEDVHMGYHAPVAVVSWSFWKSRFDLDPGVIGKKIVVGDAPITIVGVAQRGFYGLSYEAQQDIWLPVSLGPSPGWGLGLLARLKPGVSLAQARAEMAVVFQRVVNAPDADPFVRRMKTPHRASRKRRYDAFKPDALDTADGLDGNRGAAAAPCVREFSRAALGPRSIAPARNGRACLPRSASGSLAAANAHRIAVAVARRMRCRHLRGLLRSSRADPDIRIRQVHHGGAVAF